MILNEYEQLTEKLYRKGTHRTVPPSRTLERVRPYMASMGITRIANLTGLDRLGIPVVGVVRPNSRSVAVAQGKGLYLDEAKASGLMEAVECFHAETMATALTVATLEFLLRDEAVIDTQRLPKTPVGPLPSDQPIPWIRAVKWGANDHIWVPFELVSTDYTLPLKSGMGFFPANTNGLASGNHLLEAVLHGICELIERDSTALWWHRSPGARLDRSIDTETVTDSACRWVLERYAVAGVAVRVWNTTSDIGVASFLCAVQDQDGTPFPEFGAGCHPSRDIALLRALTEAAQARTTLIAGSRDDLRRRDYTIENVAARRKRFEALGLRMRGKLSIQDVPTFESDTIRDDVTHVCQCLATSGMAEIAVVDLTRQIYGIPVVRAVIPGLEGLLDDPDYVPGRRARGVAMVP